jgi:ABC-2 type transport system ATP-binding protein
MLRVSQLVKRYGGMTAVDGVSFDVERGTTFGLLGPNGAGKSTTIRMIAGILQPDGGEVTVEGAVDRRRSIGYVPQELALYDELTAAQNLRLFAAIYGVAAGQTVERVRAAADVVGLGDRLSQRVRFFSGGMKRRLNLAAALLHEPAVLLLDEPTVGVDPQSRNAIFEALEGLKAEGRAILYTTHYMEEAARLCDRVAIMDHGRILACDTPANLLRLLGDGGTIRFHIREGTWEGRELTEEGHLVFPVDNLSERLPGLLDEMRQRGVRYDEVRTEAGTLEDVFLHLTGKSLRD